MLTMESNLNLERILILSYLYLLAVYCQGPQLEFQSFKGEAIDVFENENISLNFWINMSYCMNDSTRAYRMEITTKGKDNGTEYDGKVVFKNDTCRVTRENNVHCVTPLGPAQLNKRVNISHVGILWSWTWVDCASRRLRTSEKTIQLIVSCALENEKINKSIIIAIGPVLLILFTINIVMIVKIKFIRRSVVGITTSGSEERLLPTAVNSKNDSVLGPQFAGNFLERDLKKHWFQSTWVSAKRLMPMKPNEKIDTLVYKTTPGKDPSENWETLPAETVTGRPS